MSKGTVYGLGIAAAIAAAVFAASVWPTQYRYDHINLSGRVLPVRIHRFSGTTEILYPSGWKTAGQSGSTDPAALPLPANELQKLEGNADFRLNELWCNIYNGTSYRVNEITLHVQVTEAGKTSPVIDRDYRMKNSYFTDPLETGIFNQHVGFTPQQNQKWSWFIKGAAGVKR
jgi:hypothetical protein